jgi:hypothetical protein
MPCETFTDAQIVDHTVVAVGPRSRPVGQQGAVLALEMRVLVEVINDGPAEPTISLAMLR